MKLALLAFALLLSACTSVPVKPKFPEAVPALQEKCPVLNKVEGDRVAITELLKTVIGNYALYYECSAKVDGWNEWYNDQKKIYESVK